MNNEIKTVRMICVHLSLLEKRNLFVTKYKSQKTNKIIVGTQIIKDKGNTKYVSCKWMSIGVSTLKSPPIKSKMAVNKSK